MPLHFYVVKCFVVLFSRHYIIAEKTTCRSVSGLLVESVYFDPQGHVIRSLGRVGAGSSLLAGHIPAIAAGEGDPLTQRAADLCVGILNVHYIRLFLAHAVAVGVDRQVYRFTCDSGGHVETPGDIPVFGLRQQSSIRVCLSAGEWHALAALDKRRHPFGGLDLLGAAIATGRADYPC